MGFCGYFHRLWLINMRKHVTGKLLFVSVMTTASQNKIFFSKVPLFYNLRLLFRDIAPLRLCEIGSVCHVKCNFALEIKNSLRRHKEKADTSGLMTHCRGSEVLMGHCSNEPTVAQFPTTYTHSRVTLQPPFLKYYL